MSLIGLLVTLAIVGFVGWIILQIPMPDVIQKVIIGVLVLFTVLFALQVLGIYDGFNIRLR